MPGRTTRGNSAETRAARANVPPSVAPSAARPRTDGPPRPAVQRQPLQLRAILRLHRLDLLVGAEERVLRHVRRILARLRMTPQPFGQSANVMRPRPTTHPEILDPHLVRRATKFTNLRPSTHERIEPDWKRARVTAARICQ